MPNAKPLGLLLSAALLVAPVTASASDALSIPFTKTTLKNGMTVILSVDHTLPVVEVNIVYGVGSRFEQPGRTGFAHLFEHLMFMGTRRAPRGDFDKWMEAAGGENNAGTSADHTLYYDTAPSGAIDLLLWLEADRLRDLGDLMTKEKVDLQRDVVKNERRQRYENAPYGSVGLHIPGLLWPEGHPYHHATIGSHADLEAASVEDVKAFFAKYYDPANASLVVAGDFDPTAVMDRVQAWFATIPSKGRPADPGAPGFDGNTTTLKSVARETIEDNVEQAKTIMVWQSPKHFAPGDAELDLLADALGNGKESRLYRALVYQQKLALDVDASQGSQVLASQFSIEATARPGVSLDKLEAAIDAEVAKVRAAPLGEDELAAARNGTERRFVSRLQSVGARARWLNIYESERGDPGFVQRDLDRYRDTTAAGVRDVAQRVLDPNARVILRVVPKGTKDAAAQAPKGKGKGGAK